MRLRFPTRGPGGGPPLRSLTHRPDGRPRLRLPARGTGGPPRIRFPTRAPDGPGRLPYGMTPQTLLRGLAKLVAAVLAAGLGGLAIGTALAALSGDTDSPVGVTGEPPAAPPPATSTTTTTTTTTTRTPANGDRPQRRKPAGDARVRIVSATLQPASSASGKRRQRARISVRVRVSNRGSRRLVVPRPLLVSGNDRVRTDPSQDTADTNFGALGAGATEVVTLRFETAGAVTARVRNARRARVTIAGKTVTITVKVGGPIAPAPATGERASTATATQPAPSP